MDLGRETGGQRSSRRARRRGSGTVDPSENISPKVLGALSDRLASPVALSHKTIWPLVSPEASVPPSGEKATETTCCRVSKRALTARVRVSQSVTPTFRSGAATVFPSGEKAIRIFSLCVLRRRGTFSVPHSLLVRRAESAGAADGETAGGIAAWLQPQEVGDRACSAPAPAWDDLLHHRAPKTSLPRESTPPPQADPFCNSSFMSGT